MPTERAALVEEIAAKIGDVLVSDVEDPVSEAWALAEAVLSVAERHFARRVAEAVAAEREACAKVCDELAAAVPIGDQDSERRAYYLSGREKAFNEAAAAIRARDAAQGGRDGETTKG